MSLTDYVDTVRTFIENDPEFWLPDLGSILRQTVISDGMSGHKLSESTVASSIKCLQEEISGGVQVVAGGVTSIHTHRLFMLASGSALTITESDKFKVEPRDDNSQMIFEQLTREKNSLNPLAVFTAILVTKGYRQPAAT